MLEREERVEGDGEMVTHACLAHLTVQAGHVQGEVVHCGSSALLTYLFIYRFHYVILCCSLSTIDVSIGNYFRLRM